MPQDGTGVDEKVKPEVAPSTAEKAENAVAARSLRKSLQELRILSNNTTSRLDNTYYSVLEKFSALQSTVAALQELSLVARRLNDDFNEESQTITKEVQDQIDAFQGFEAQQRKIETLQSRIQIGTDKVDKLAARVEVVRKRAEGWATVEEQWQEKTRRRIRLFWAISATTLLVLLGLLIFQYTPARTLGPGVLKGFDPPDVGDVVSKLEADVFNDSFTLKRQASHVLDELRRVPDAPLEDDPRLKAFDEL